MDALRTFRNCLGAPELHLVDVHTNTNLENVLVVFSKRVLNVVSQDLQLALLLTELTRQVSVGTSNVMVSGT